MIILSLSIPALEIEASNFLLTFILCFKAISKFGNFICLSKLFYTFLCFNLEFGQVLLTVFWIIFNILSSVWQQSKQGVEKCSYSCSKLWVQNHLEVVLQSSNAYYLTRQFFILSKSKSFVKNLVKSKNNHNWNATLKLLWLRFGYAHCSALTQKISAHHWLESAPDIIYTRDAVSNPEFPPKLLKIFHLTTL